MEKDLELEGRLNFETEQAAAALREAKVSTQQLAKNLEELTEAGNTNSIAYRANTKILAERKKEVNAILQAEKLATKEAKLQGGVIESLTNAEGKLKFSLGEVKQGLLDQVVGFGVAQLSVQGIIGTVQFAVQVYEDFRKAQDAAFRSSVQGKLGTGNLQQFTANGTGVNLGVNQLEQRRAEVARRTALADEEIRVRRIDAEYSSSYAERAKLEREINALTEERNKLTDTELGLIDAITAKKTEVAGIEAELGAQARVTSLQAQRGQSAEINLIREQTKQLNEKTKASALQGVSPDAIAQSVAANNMISAKQIADVQLKYYRQQLEFELAVEDTKIKSVRNEEVRTTRLIELDRQRALLALRFQEGISEKLKSQMKLAIDAAAEEQLEVARLGRIKPLELDTSEQLRRRLAELENQLRADGLAKDLEAIRLKYDEEIAQETNLQARKLLFKNKEKEEDAAKENAQGFNFDKAFRESLKTGGSVAASNITSVIFGGGTQKDDATAERLRLIEFTKTEREIRKQTGITAEERSLRLRQLEEERLNYIRQQGRTIADDIGGALVGAAEAFGQALIGQLLQAAASEAVKGILSLLPGGGILSAIGSLAGFAEGTRSAPSGTAIVGEFGPELLRLRGGEQITPSGQLGDQMRSLMASDRKNGGGGLDTQAIVEAINLGTRVNAKKRLEANLDGEVVQRNTNKRNATDKRLRG